MMTIDKLKDAVIGCGNSLYFTYHGEAAGIEPTVKNSVFSYEMWHGTKYRSANDFDEMVNDKFFDGKSLLDIMNQVTLDLR